jgi:hypothetical protein
MGWYVAFREGSQTLTQTAEDKYEAILVASEVYLSGHRVLSVGPFGHDALSAHEIEGAESQNILRKLL